MRVSATTVRGARLLSLAICAALSAISAQAQEADHSTMDHSTMQHAAPQQAAREDAPAGSTATPREEPDTTVEPGTSPAAPDHASMDHASHGQGESDGSEADVEVLEAQRVEVDHSKMDHSTMDHSKMDHSTMDHSTMDRATGTPDHGTSGGSARQPREPIPVLTDADRRAAFPEVAAHASHGDAINSYFLANRIETWDADQGTGAAWEAQAWVGKDIDRLWFRSEGERSGGATEAADVEVLYGRSISPWWDVVVGARHDFAPGNSQSHLAIGLMGLAPQKFEIEATAYLSEHGRVSARVEVEYEMLLTNRLILQPLLEASMHGSDDQGRGIGSGLGTVETGLRLRYEFTRQFAPYVGLVHERAFGETADLQRASGEGDRDTRVVAGVRIWF